MNASSINHRSHPLKIAIAFSLAVAIAGCNSKDPQSPVATAVAPAEVPGITADQVTKTWSAEALEELLAPVALYPDPVLSQMMIAATNPQEVLDAGNWILQNESLKGNALDDAAAEVGFTPPIRALVQFPEVIDMMCQEMEWTTELGEAFTADQPGVLAAIQRLRFQAQDVGNLQSSPQMTVVNEMQDGQDVIILQPADPTIVYVPQYNPEVIYAPAPSTTVVTQQTGFSGGALLLAFGAGMLVNEIFDNNNDYYYPRYGYGRMPYYPPYPYRPRYGNNFYPNHNYNRPPNYNSGWQHNGNININGDVNIGGGKNNYWNKYDKKSNNYNRNRTADSPITRNKPNRSDLNDLNKRKPSAMPSDVKRPSANATASNWKGQSGYAGNNKVKTGNAGSSKDRIANANPGYSKPSSKAGSRDASKSNSKVQGSYAGARPSTNNNTRDVQKPNNNTRDFQKQNANTRDVQKPNNNTRNAQKPAQNTSQKQFDRGRSQPSASNGQKSTRQPQQQNRQNSSKGGGGRNSAVSGSRGGGNTKAASQRGKQSKSSSAGNRNRSSKKN
jgi:hypothetical protein